MNESIKFILSLIAVIIVGLILMVATGLTVYYGFCPPGRAGSVVDTHSIPNADCNCPRPSNCTAEKLCPIEPAELCPIHPLMPAPPDPNACILPCCTPPPKKTISQWQPAPPRPVLPKLTEEEIASKTVLEWVMSTRPNSMERLNVLTQLMEFGVEPYVHAMSRRNCKAPYRMCTMCRSDRYEYLRCAMRTRVTANKFGYSVKNKLTKVNPNFLEQFAKDAHWMSLNYNNYLTLEDYEPLTEAYRAFWFIGDDKGKRTECSWCTDAYDPPTHLDCLRTGWGSI